VKNLTLRTEVYFAPNEFAVTGRTAKPGANKISAFTAPAMVDEIFAFGTSWRCSEKRAY
jgi:hypothetical protein